MNGAYRKTAAFLGITLLVLALPAAGRGEQPGRLSGTVYDQTGGVLVEVILVLRGPVVREGRTDAAGRFEFRDLPAGDFELRASREGFETVARSVEVPPAEAVSVTLAMNVAALDEAVVTAAKAGVRDVQTMPMAITAVPDEDLARLAVRGVDQAAALMPSVTFTQNSSFGQLSIRGIGTNAVNAGADPSSAMYLDGVYLARPAMAFADFLDLDRVEVLRGPQGTLYGRNAVGGALNLVSRAPSNDLEAAARVTAGNLDELRAEARVSGPLRRDAAMGSASLVWGRRDGYVRDLEHPDHPLGGDELLAARGQLRLVLGRRADLLVAADVTDQDGPLLTFNKVLQEKPGFAIDNPADLREVRASTVASSSLMQYGASARLTAALGPSTTLVSLTAFRGLENLFLVDADITELDVLSTNNREHQRQVSEELTVSHRRRRGTLLAGVFLFGEDDHQEVWVGQPPSATQVHLDPRVRATSAAVFAQANVAVTGRLGAVVGLRYTREGKDIDNDGGRYTLAEPRALLAGSRYTYDDSITHAAWTPRFALELKLPRGALAYVSATRGFKSGGFNLSSPVPGRGYAPEFAWSYEAGLKTEPLGGRARVNVAAFHMDYADLQVQTPIGIGVFDIRNAAAATIQGVELEAGTRIGGGLQAGGHVAWLDATYDRYVAVALGGVTGDVSGNRLTNAPEWSGRLWVEWAGNVGASGRLTLTADATAQSTVYYTPFNDDLQRQPSYGLLGARAEYGPGHRRWAVNAYARNLTDTDYIMATFATSPVAFGGRPGPSRQFGVQLMARR